MKTCLQLLVILGILFSTPLGYAKDYIIYSISQGIPMGSENEIIKKNFYINMGEQQGIQKGSVLDVYRIISRLDPYETKKRYNHKVKIGEIEVVHAEENNSITRLVNVNLGEKTPLFEIENMMIGDHISVKID